MVNRGVNKVILIGNLGQDPEVRHIPNGGVVTNITIATSESWRDKHTGELKEKTEWHRVVLFGKLAEIAGEYLRKGSQVYIEGSLQTRKWQHQNGQDRYITEVIVNINGSMQMLGGRHGSLVTHAIQESGLDQSQQFQSNQTQFSDNNKNPVSSPTKHSIAAPTNESPIIDFDDDIPF